MKNAEVKEILSKRLRELTEENRDYNYRMSDKKQAEAIGIPYPTFRNYLDGKSDCSASNLILLSKFYNVSADYLLGLTNYSSDNINARAFCDDIGLSELSVHVLYSNLYTDIFNKLFECLCFEDLLSVLDEIKDESEYWLECAKENNNISKSDLDHIDTFRYRAHKVFELVLDDFDQRTYNPELTKEIINATTEHQKSIENEIGKLKVELHTASSEQQKEIIKRIIELKTTK